MIPVAGHTPGMMCPLIEEDRICIFGDACGVSVLLMGEYSSNVSEYKQSLLNLKNLKMIMIRFIVIMVAMYHQRNY